MSGLSRTSSSMSNGSGMKRKATTTAPPNGPGVAGLNAALVNYVKQQGLVHSAQTLVEELEHGDAYSNGKKKRVGESMQFGAYRDGYERLRKWITTSLDQFRDELWPVLWVVYVHSYISLMESGEVDGAVSFRSIFRSDHESNHFDDLLEMDSISTKKQVKENDFAQRILRSKFQIRLCQYSCELLLTFLMEHDLLFIAAIVNERIDVSIGEPPTEQISCFGQTVTGVLEMDASSAILTGTEPTSISKMNSKLVKWHVPTCFKALVGGATGALAVAKTYPDVPKDYLANNEKKDETNVLTEEEILKLQQTGALKQLDKKTNLPDPKRKVDDSTKKGSGKDKKVYIDNHTAPKDNHPEMDKQYFKDIQIHLLAPLRLTEVSSPPELIRKTVGERAKEYAKQISKAVDLVNQVQMQQQHQQQLQDLGAAPPLPQIQKKWPSIAFQTFFNARDSLICVNNSMDSKVFAAGFDDSVLRIWYYPEPEVASAAPINNRSTTEPIGEDLYGHSGPVYACSISPDNNSMVSCSEDGTIRLWMSFPELYETPKEDVTSENRMQQEVGDDQMEVDDLDVTDDKKKKRNPHKKKKRGDGFKTYRQGSWRNVFTYRPRPSCPIWDVKFSPAGYYFASGSYDGVVRVWCVERPQPLRLFTGHLADVDCIAWHPNCQYIASGSSDKTVRVWDMQAGNNNVVCMRLFCGHVRGVSAVNFSTSGRYLVSGGLDHLVIVWDFATAERVFVLQGHTGPVWSVSISQDNEFIASGSGDGTVRVWDTNHIWGKASLPYFLASNGISSGNDNNSVVTGSTKPNTQPANQQLHIPKEVKTKPECRSFPTKFTPVHFVKFSNERLLFSAGNFALNHPE